jgi:ATP-dependent Lhr-like helicase
LAAPTGSGKTLAAFFAALDRLSFAPAATHGSVGRRGTRVLYISPLKALAADVDKNLVAPLRGIGIEAARLGIQAAAVDVFVRTGDTSAAERARRRRVPADILITTPESLYLTLTSGARETLRDVETVIVDEIHSLVASKRGAHLFLSLERLEEERRLSERALAGGWQPLQRIGLSATQKPLEEVARLLGGFDDNGQQRPVTIVDAGERKTLELAVEMPDPSLTDGDSGGFDGAHFSAEEGTGRARPESPLHRTIVDRIAGQRSTMVFVNSRRQAERLAAAINEIAEAEIALAHHGSVAHETRKITEDRLKKGNLPAIVATSSLELGIDIGAVDQVIQVEAPPSVAAGLQRIGRAKHQVGGIPRGVLCPKHRADLVACAAVTRAMVEGAVEETYYPRNPLDIVAQQVVAMVAVGASVAGLPRAELLRVVRRAAPFATLDEELFDGVLDMLTGRYPSDDFADLKPKLRWDRNEDLLYPRVGALRLAVINGGTIPDRGLYGVFLRTGPGGDEKTSRRVGELDEEMVFELRVGEAFLLGATSWIADEITHDRVFVLPAHGKPGKMPFWRGDRPGRPVAFGRRMGALVGAIAKDPAGAFLTLTREHFLTDEAARQLVEYVEEQKGHSTQVPTEKVLVLERYLDELGDHRICLHSPFGSRVHAPWATAILAQLRERHPGDVEAVHSEDGIVFRVPYTEGPLDPTLFFPDPDEIETLVTEELGGTSLFASRFRENAGRSLLLPKRMPGRRTPLWAQRKRSADLLAVASQYPTFPIVLETYREVLRDVYDVPGLIDLLSQVQRRKIRVVVTEPRTPSPFATSLVFSFIGNFLYDGDSPLAERRARALLLDHGQLAKLLGEAELRKLLDPEAIVAVEDRLQRRAYPPQHADALHDQLLALGDRSEAELGAGWALAEALEARGSALLVRIAGELRAIATEDAARYRDALGTVLPPGVPAIFLKGISVDSQEPWNPLAQLVGRYARTHGPFRPERIAARFGLPIGVIVPALDALVARGRLEKGAFLSDSPAGDLPSVEYCDKDVLRQIKQGSLARARAAVEPVPPVAYGKFLLEWQGLRAKHVGEAALFRAIEQLQGVSAPLSLFEDELFPARVADYQPRMLDGLCAAGAVVWRGTSEGNIAFYISENTDLFPAPNLEERKALSAPATKLLALLEERGALFFAEIQKRIGGFPTELADALWELVWAGFLTNDTVDPLRALDGARGTGSSRRDLRGPSWLRPARSGDARADLRGRWSTTTPPEATDTARLVARVRMLLDRYGVLLRETASHEEIPGGFSAIYEILKQLEDGGKLRRGHFVAGRGATQFALPGAEELLRSFDRGASDFAGSGAARDGGPTSPARSGPEGPTWIAAQDPACAWGAALPWPRAAGSVEVPTEGRAGARRPARSAGAHVLLREGEPIAWCSRDCVHVILFAPEGGDDIPRQGATFAAAAISALAEKDGRPRMIETLNALPARESPLAPLFEEAGFHRQSNGLQARRREQRATGHRWFPPAAENLPPANFPAILFDDEADD